MAAKPTKTGRTYGRTTAWLMRVRLGLVGSVSVRDTGNVATMSVQPYNGGEARWVPQHVLSKTKDGAERLRAMPVPLMEYPEYPKCDCWMRA